MKKIILLLSVISIISFGGIVQPVSAADKNDFAITNYDIQMQLSRDDTHQSKLKTVETITADFPEGTKARGIERILPSNYDGHSLNLEVDSVTDRDGTELKHWVFGEGNNTIIRVGQASDISSGEKTYVIIYRQSGVTQYFEDDKKDEFYWNTNGTQWRVPINKLSVRLAIDEEVTGQLDGDVACYQGKQGSKDTCDFKQNRGTITTTAENLSPGENISLAVGFEPETFTAYVPTLKDKLIGYFNTMAVYTFIPSAAVLAWIIARFWRITRRTKELQPITPEYLPPKGISVTVAAEFDKSIYSSTMAAQLIDLAVRGYIKLHEVKPKKFIFPGQYEIEVVRDVSTLLPEEQKMLFDMFGELPMPPQRLNLKKLRYNSAYRNRTRNNEKFINKMVDEVYQLKVKDPSVNRWFLWAAIVCLLVGAAIFSVFLLFAAFFAFMFAYEAKVLTDRGLALSRYLKGLKMYIGIAEKDRLAMLQSPEGALKVPRESDESDEAVQIKLYERLLPYAMLYKQERQWSKQLGRYYESADANPTWYEGMGVFSAVALASAIRGVSIASTLGNPASSGSGGSGGAGFSGGGGGGGGGGGW